MKILPLAKRNSKLYDKKSITTIYDMSYEQKKESDYKKVSTKEFIDLSIWTLKFVFNLAKVKTVLYIVFTTLNGLFNIAYAFVFAKALDFVLAIGSGQKLIFSSVYQVLLLLFVLFAVQTIIQSIDSYLSNSLRTLTRPKITQAFYTKLSNLGVQSLEQPEINNKITRANDNLQNIYPYVDDLIQEVSDIINLIGTATTLVIVSPVLIVLMVIIYLPYLIWDKKFRGLMYQYSYENTERFRSAGWTNSQLNNSTQLQEIAATSSFSFLDKKYMNFYDWYMKKWLVIMKRWRVGNGSFGFLTDFVLLFGYFKIFTNIINKSITIGTATFQIRMLGMLQNNLSNVLRGMNDLSEFALRIKDTYSLFIAEPVFGDGSKTFARLQKGPEIEVKEVSFKYPNSEKLIFDNLSLRIKSGEKVAIVGHNGAGKTTLVKLLCRTYIPTIGKIVINDQNLRDLRIDDWYQNIGVLFQEFNTYPQLTARENIYIGNPTEPLDEMALRLAAQSADALEFIEEFPNKFDQILSEKFKGGIRPSTGQWQKLAIARFFYRNAPLVIFDEPTASIDAVSEYNIFNKIYDFFKEKTVIIISHRFSTVRNADRIIVLDHGEIVEEGTHDFLMGNNGYYAKAFNLQAKGYSDDGE
jgi:ABC-type multidrug transport system fused ATPase/permease subunit